MNTQTLLTIQIGFALLALAALTLAAWLVWKFFDEIQRIRRAVEDIQRHLLTQNHNPFSPSP